jgi:hypothetical protein
MNEQQTKQRGGWFRRKGRDTVTTPTAPQAGSSGKFTQWLYALQERMDNANRTRDLANRLNSDLAGILQTCAAQDQALGQRNMRTQVQLSMSLGRLTGIVRQFEATRNVCSYLLQATSPQLPVVSAALADGSANGATATLAAPASPSRPLFAAGNASGPLSAPVVRNLGRGGYKRMARDLQQLYRETEQATRGILHPIQSQGIHLPEVNALANALAALEPLMTWLNQRCEQLTVTYCSPSASESGNPAGQRPDFWQ